MSNQGVPLPNPTRITVDVSSLYPTKHLPFVCRGEGEGVGIRTGECARHAWHESRVRQWESGGCLFMHHYLHALICAQGGGRIVGTLAETRGVSKRMDAHTRQGGRVVYALTYAYALFSFIFMVFMTQITFDKKPGTENADRPVGIDPAPTSTASFVLCARPFATSVFLPLVPYHSLFVPFSPHDLFRRCLGRLAQVYATSHTIFPSK